MCKNYPKALEGTDFIQKHDPSNFCWVHLQCGDIDPCFEAITYEQCEIQWSA